MTTKTYHRGAQEERIAVFNKARRMVRTGGTFAQFIVWMGKRVQRYKARPGGL